MDDAPAVVIWPERAKIFRARLKLQHTIHQVYMDRMDREGVRAIDRSMDDMDFGRSRNSHAKYSPRFAKYRKRFYNYALWCLSDMENDG